MLMSPAKLEHLRAAAQAVEGWEHWATSVNPWAVGLFPLIQRHRHTLRTLSLMPVSTWAGETTFDLRDFTSLVELTISCWHEEGRKDTNPTDELELLAPALRILRWDFRMYEDGTAPLSRKHYEYQLSWLRRLVKAAVMHVETLERIEILYPDDGLSVAWPPLDTRGENHYYPWEDFQDIANEVRPSGVDVWYAEPQFSVTRNPEQAQA